MSKDIAVGAGGWFVFRAHRDIKQDHRRIFTLHAGAPSFVFCRALQPCLQMVKLFSIEEEEEEEEEDDDGFSAHQ